MSKNITPCEKQLVASAVIISNGNPKKALLVHHKKFNVWLQPGGHAEWNENPVEAAIRETKEETGLDISFLADKIQKIEEVYVLPIPDYYFEETIPAHGVQPAHIHLDHLYVVEVPEQKVVKQDEESHDIGWFTLEETENLDIFENTRMILRKVLA